MPPVRSWRLRSGSRRTVLGLPRAERRDARPTTYDDIPRRALRKNDTLAEYQNPQHEPGGDRRLLVIFLVSFAVMLLSQPLLKRFFPTPAAPQKLAQA